MAHGRLRVATAQFAVSVDIARNARAMREQMRQARDLGAELVHFSEACLSGYAGAEFNTWNGFDWARLRSETDALRELARELKLWLCFGTAHPARGSDKPHNSLYLVDPDGTLRRRYDKRFCTRGDLRYYTPGTRFAVETVNGIKVGMLICYDFRFPEIYRAYYRRGVRLMLHSFHQSRETPNALMRQVAPAHIMSRAAENFMYVSANNTSKRYQWFASRIHTPDGGIAAIAPRNRRAIVACTVDLAMDATFYDAVTANIRPAMDGALHTGDVERPPRRQRRR